MTLCIGAMALQQSPLEKRIVLCFDYKLAGDEFGSEREYKFHRLSGQLVCMFAGAPGRAKELALIYQDFLNHNTLSFTDAPQRLKEPLEMFKLRHAEHYIRSRLCFSYQQLLDSGEKWLGKDGRDRYLAAIDAHDLRVSLIIAGFVDSAPVLFQTRGIGLRDLDLEVVTNFCLIGTGAYTAEPALHARNQIFTTALPRTLYNVYEAKRLGQASPYVGTKTRMYVLRPPSDGSNQIGAERVTREGEKWLARLFRKLGPKPMGATPEMPQPALEEISLEPLV